MTDPGACRAALEAARVEPARLDAAARHTLAAAGEPLLETALREFAAAHGAAALPLLTTLAADEGARGVRRAAKRALYRLAQQRRPVVERRPEQVSRAWLSGVDGTGSRAVWVLFEGGFGGSALCSLIVNDVAGILDAAGGDITRKRLEEELRSLRASQKLPWIEVPPARAVGIVGAALEVHTRLGTSPPAAFARWRPRFESATVEATPTRAPARVDPALAERAGELLAMPELASWFIDPEAVQSDALALLEARQSRLVVSDQIKAEREASIVVRIVERELPPDVRRRWAQRLDEMAFVFDATGRVDAAAIARATAAALADEGVEITRQPFSTGLARRALEIAGEVAAGRLNAADVSRKP